MWGVIALLAALGVMAILVVVTLAITIMTDIWYCIFPSRNYTGQLFGIAYAMTKICDKCGETKPLTEFHQDSNSSDGHRGHCKECQKEYYKAWREANKERNCQGHDH